MHERGRRIAIVALTACLGLTSVAAGGSPTLSERQWRKRANAICVRDEKTAAAVRKRAFKGLQADEQPSLGQITAYVKGIAPLVRTLVHDIDALREPRTLEKKVKRYVTTARRELARLVADPSIGLEGNPFSETGLRAAALDLKSCA